MKITTLSVLNTDVSNNTSIYKVNFLKVFMAGWKSI